MRVVNSNMPPSGTTLLRVMLVSHPNVNQSESRLLNLRKSWLKATLESQRRLAEITANVLDRAVGELELKAYRKTRQAKKTLVQQGTSRQLTTPSSDFAEVIFVAVKVFRVRKGRRQMRTIRKLQTIVGSGTQTTCWQRFALLSAC